MRALLTTSLTLTTLLTLTSAAALQNAIIVIEASHGGAGQDLTNTTITVPFTATYTNSSALDEVSTLYIVDSTGGIPLDSISCTPYLHADGTGDAGLAFTSHNPSELSTNTVQVGSIVCITTHISYAPPGGPPGGPEPLTTSSASASSNLTKTLTSRRATVTGATSTLVKTTSAAAGTTAMQQSTVTSVVSPSSSAASATGGSGETSTTASASASLTSGNAASGLGLGSEFYGGLALAGFGLAFAL